MVCVKRLTLLFILLPSILCQTALEDEGEPFKTAMPLQIKTRALFPIIATGQVGRQVASAVLAYGLYRALAPSSLLSNLAGSTLPFIPLLPFIVLASGPLQILKSLLQSPVTLEFLSALPILLSSLRFLPLFAGFSLLMNLIPSPSTLPLLVSLLLLLPSPSKLVQFLGALPLLASLSLLLPSPSKLIPLLGASPFLASLLLPQFSRLITFLGTLLIPAIIPKLVQTWISNVIPGPQLTIPWALVPSLPLLPLLSLLSLVPYKMFGSLRKLPIVLAYNVKKIKDIVMSIIKNDIEPQKKMIRNIFKLVHCIAPFLFFLTLNKLPSIKLPDIQLPSIKLPDIELPNFEFPNLLKKLPGLSLKLPPLALAWPILKKLLPKLPIPKLPGLELPKLPGLPKLLTLPKLPVLPKLPSLPKLPEIPKLPTLPKLPELPKLPTLPKLPKLPSLSKLNPLKPDPEKKSFDLTKYGLPGVELIPGISKDQISEFEKFMKNLLPPGTDAKTLRLMSEWFAPVAANLVPMLLDFGGKSGPKLQQALALPLQYFPGGKKYNSLNLGNRPGLNIDLGKLQKRPRRSLGGGMALKFMLDGVYDVFQDATNNQKLTSGMEVMLAFGVKFILPVAAFFTKLPSAVQSIFRIPEHLFSLLPKFHIESADLVIQPLPVRLIQAFLPLWTYGNWSVFYLLLTLFPLPLRLFYAFLPNPSGYYDFPQKWEGFLPDRLVPKLQIELPDGQFKAITEVLPYILHLPTIQIPQEIYDWIKDHLPSKLADIKQNLHSPTIHIRPFAIFGLYPKLRTTGGNDEQIKITLLLAELAGPLIFVISLTQPLLVLPALLVAMAVQLPALYVFSPLRWLNPSNLIKVAAGEKSLI